MSEEKTPIDGEYGLDYQLFVMEKMLEQLPGTVKDNCIAQLNSVREAISNREKLFKKLLLVNLEDLRLEIKSMNFDLISTKRERDQLQKIVDDLTD